MLCYPVTLAKDDNGTLLVTSPDFPELTTFGEDREDALRRAFDALLTVIQSRMTDRQAIPAPSAAKRGQAVVTLTALMESKLALYRAMLKRGIRKAHLARRLNIHAPQVDRLLNLSHDSRLDQIESAARILGLRLQIKLVSAA